MKPTSLVHHQLTIEALDCGDGEQSRCAQLTQPLTKKNLKRCFSVLNKMGHMEPLVQHFPDLFSCARCSSKISVMQNQTKAYLFFQALQVIHPAINISLGHCDGCEKEHMYLHNIPDGAPCHCEKCGLEVLIFGALLASEGQINYQASSHSLVKDMQPTG